MNRTALAIAAAVATVALIVPLAATATHRPGHKQPGGPNANPNLSIGAEPNPVPFGKTTTISGKLTGSDNASKTIELGENKYPFRDNDPFKKIAETTTDANGDYSFTVTPELNTNYRTLAKTDPQQVSSAAFVRVKMRISRSVDDTTPDRGQTVTFTGKVAPAHDGDTVLIQRRRPTGTWRTLQNVPLQPGPGGEDSSEYSAQVTINRDGVWRARIRRDEDHLGNRSRRIRLDVP